MMKLLTKLLLQEEWDRPYNGEQSKVKALFIRTHPQRRAEVLSEEDNATTQSTLQKYKMLM